MSGYPDDWDRIRKRVYERDNYTCQGCGETDTELHAHHIVPKSDGGSDRMDNLLTLCKPCHERIHGYQIGETDQQREIRKQEQEIEQLTQEIEGKAERWRAFFRRIKELLGPK